MSRSTELAATLLLNDVRKEMDKGNFSGARLLPNYLNMI